MTENPQENQNSKSSFEEVFLKLRDSVQALEGSDLSLEDSMRIYEEGMQLARQCNQILNDTELRITKLQDEYGKEPSGNSDS